MVKNKVSVNFAKLTKKVMLYSLVAIMIISSLAFLASCAKTDLVNEKNNTAITLTFYGIKGDNVSDESIKAVQEEVNKITHGSSYNVQLELRFYTKAEYMDHVLADLDSYRNIYNERLASAGNSDTTPDGYDFSGIETQEKTDSLNVSYPPAANNQVDIFLVTNYEDYKFFNDHGLLTYFTDDDLELYAPYIAGQYPKILLEEIGLTLNTGMGAIPSLSTIGDYQYMLINRDLYDKYTGIWETITENGVEKKVLISTAESLLRNEIKNTGNYNITKYSTLWQYLSDIARLENGVTPIYNFPIDLYVQPYSGIGQYFGVSDSALSKINYNAINEFTTFPDEKTIVNSPAFLRFFTDFAKNEVSAQKNPTFLPNLIYMFENLASTYDLPIPNFENELDMTANFGIGFMKGSAAVPNAYSDDYYVIKLSDPYLTTEKLYNNMFALNANCDEKNRALKIIELLIKDETINNLLAYGVYGTNYTINEDGYINRSGNYIMDLNHIGNQFVLKPNTEMNAEQLALSASKWSLGKSQNIDAYKGAFLNFTFEYYKYSYDINFTITDGEAFLKKYYRGIEEATLSYLQDHSVSEQSDFLMYNFSYKTRYESMCDYLDEINYPITELSKEISNSIEKIKSFNYNDVAASYTSSYELNLDYRETVYNVKVYNFGTSSATFLDYIFYIVPAQLKAVKLKYPDGTEDIAIIEYFKTHFQKSTVSGTGDSAVYNHTSNPYYIFLLNYRVTPATTE